MSDLTFIDLIMALQQANTLASELNMAEELDDEIMDRIQKLEADVRKARKKIYQG